MAFPDTTGVGPSNDRLFIGQNHLICTFLRPDTMEMTSTNRPASLGSLLRGDTMIEPPTLTALHLKHDDYIIGHCWRADVRTHYVRHHFFQHVLSFLLFMCTVCTFKQTDMLERVVFPDKTPFGNNQVDRLSASNITTLNNLNLHSNFIY